MTATDAPGRPNGERRRASRRRGRVESSAVTGPGTVVISVDAELGWGFHDLHSPPADRVEYARTGWLRLLSLFDAFDVPATWAVVGHLFLDSCDGVHATHPASEGWFDRECDAWADRPELRFADGLIARIREADADHEIGCHGFSHVLFDDDATGHGLALAEVRRSAAAAGHDFDSFVFPRNRPGHRAALAEAGIDCYRGPAPAESLDDTPLRPVAKLGRGLLGRTPPLVTPARDDEGLVDVPASMYLFGFEAPARSLVEPLTGDPVVRRARRGIDAAAATGGLLHLWLHPNNLTYDRHVRRMCAVLEHVAARRDAGDVVVETMCDVAARV
jgi:peptidoglycan/xylan/chitin deacetylase (PgdA/CDA1 family)